jgi:plasmid stabilization system protein ParE
LRIDFHPAASDEVESVHRWYGERSPNAAVRFREELDAAIAHIQADPERGAAYLHGTRFYLMRRFPYLVVYHRPNEELIEVVAVAHGRRRERYWKARMS